MEMIRFNKEVNWWVVTYDNRIPLIHVNGVNIVDNGHYLIFEVWSNFHDLILEESSYYQFSDSDEAHLVNVVISDVKNKFNTELGFSETACSEILTKAYITSFAVLSFLIEPRLGVLYSETDPYYIWSVNDSNL